MGGPDNKFREGQYGPCESTAEKVFLRKKLNINIRTAQDER